MTTYDTQSSCCKTLFCELPTSYLNRFYTETKGARGPLFPNLSIRLNILNEYVGSTHLNDCFPQMTMVNLYYLLLNSSPPSCAAWMCEIRSCRSLKKLKKLKRLVKWPQQCSTRPMPSLPPISVEGNKRQPL